MTLCISGDVFLVYGMYENYFIAGVCFFGIAQMFYTMSFGWEMCNYVSMMMMVSMNYILQVFFLRNISFIVISELSLQKYKTRRFIRWSLVTACCSLLWDGEQLMLQLFPMLPVGILSWSCYSFNFSGWERIYSLLGGIVFVVSDLLIAINQFVRPVPNHKLYILSTYFFAQYCLAQWSICKAQRMPKMKTN